jgi:hypothetical protein
MLFSFYDVYAEHIREELSLTSVAHKRKGDFLVVPYKYEKIQCLCVCSDSLDINWDTVKLP